MDWKPWQSSVLDSFDLFWRWDGLKDRGGGVSRSLSGLVLLQLVGSAQELRCSISIFIDLILALSKSKVRVNHPNWLVGSESLFLYFMSIRFVIYRYSTRDSLPSFHSQSYLMSILQRTETKLDQTNRGKHDRWGIKRNEERERGDETKGVRSENRLLLFWCFFWIFSFSFFLTFWRTEVYLYLEREGIGEGERRERRLRDSLLLAMESVPLGGRSGCGSSQLLFGWGSVDW